MMSNLVKFFFIEPLLMIFKPKEISNKRIKYIASEYGAEALQSDWKNVGADIKKAISIYKGELKCRETKI